MSKYKDILKESHRQGNTYVNTHYTNHDPVSNELGLARLKRHPATSSKYIPLSWPLLEIVDGLSIHEEVMSG